MNANDLQAAILDAANLCERRAAELSDNDRAEAAWHLRGYADGLTLAADDYQAGHYADDYQAGRRAGLKASEALFNSKTVAEYLRGTAALLKTAAAE